MKTMIDGQLFRKILVPVDGSRSCLHAKMLASSIANSFKSKVTVVHVVSHEFMHPELKAQYRVPPPILRRIDELYFEAGKKIIKNAEDLFREEGIQINARLVTHEDPAENVLQLVRDEGYNLVIMGNRAESQTERFSLGSITEKVARYSNCPVLIIKKKTVLHKILVAVDGSKSADKALDYAVRLTKRYNAFLSMLHVEEEKLVRIGGPKVLDCVGTIGECILKDESKKVQGVLFETLLKYGNPAETIIQIAKKGNIDLIVVGSRGLSSVKRFLLGSVSDDISMHSRNSVLIVR